MALYGMGKDYRTGLTTSDAAAKTILTTGTTGTAYRYDITIIATASASASSTYVLTFTQGGSTVTVTATSSGTTFTPPTATTVISGIITPDANTNIQVQYTRGATSTNTVAAVVQQVI